MFALQMCYQLPDQHPLSVATKHVLNTVPSARSCLIEWVNKTQDLDPCQLEIKEHGGDVKDVAFLPNQQRLAAAGDQGVIKVFDAVSGELELQLPTQHVGRIKSLAVSATGEFLVSGGEDHAVCVWDVSTGRLTLMLRGHCQGNPKCSCSFNNWGLSANPDCLVSGHAGVVRCVAFSTASDDRLASSSNDKSVKIWDRVHGSLRCTLTGHAKPVSCITFASHDRIISGSEDRSIRVWDAGSGVCLRTIHTSRGVTAVKCSPDGERVASGCVDACITIWRTATWECLHTISGHGSEAKIAHIRLAFSPDGQTLASGYKNIKMWDVASGTCVSTLSGLSGMVSSLSFSSTGGQVASASGSSVRVWMGWDALGGAAGAALPCHNDWVTQVEFEADGATVVSRSEDGETRRWDAGGAAVVRSDEDGEVLGFSFSTERSCRRLVVDGNIVYAHGELVLVYKEDACAPEDASGQASSRRPFAMFRATSAIQSMHVSSHAGRIALGLQNGQVLFLRAPFLARAARQSRANVQGEWGALVTPGRLFGPSPAPVAAFASPRPVSAGRGRWSWGGGGAGAADGGGSFGFGGRKRQLEGQAVEGREQAAEAGVEPGVGQGGRVERSTKKMALQLRVDVSSGSPSCASGNLDLD